MCGLIPSLLWLLYYLRKDCHPEPKRLIFLVFVGGAIFALLAIILQDLFGSVVGSLYPSMAGNSSSIFYLWAALVEELVKFLTVYFLVLHNPEFDEPVDAMIYLIVAGLGFAAIENTLVLFHNYGTSGPTCLGVGSVWCIWGLRALGATLLHALSSALLGYFLGLSWFYHHHSKKILLCGFVIATLFHFTFNSLLVSLDPMLGVFATSAVLLVMIVLISFLFSTIKLRMKLQA